MADTVAATGLTPQQWDDKFFKEYFQENRFAREMGRSENSIIQVKEDLTKKKGDSVTFALVNRATGAGVTGSSTLKGNEEAITSRSFRLEVNLRRNAFVTTEWDEQKSAIDLRNAMRSVAMDWAQENTRDRIITELGAINGVAYASASETQKDAWLVDNSDRVLFGAAVSNNSSNDHSASLANIDNTADKLDTGALSLMKRIALSASPKVRPIRSTSTGRRYYVCYAGTRTFRDIKSDTVIQQAQREVSMLGQNEKLFEGGDLMWDGIIIKEIDDIPVYTGVGAGAIDVAPVYLCGAQAIGYAIAKRWETRTDEDDYKNRYGVGVREIGNFGKMIFGSGSGDTDDTKDHGVVTGYFAAVADS